MTRTGIFRAFVVLVLQAAYLGVYGCGWSADGREPILYRVEHPTIDRAHTPRVVCVNFDTDTERDAAFREGAIHQASLRGISVTFGLASTVPSADAVIAKTAPTHAARPPNIPPTTAVFALIAAPSSGREPATILTLSDNPTLMDYSEAGRRAVDLAADYLRGITPPRVVAINQPRATPDHQERKR